MKPWIVALIAAIIGAVALALFMGLDGSNQVREAMDQRETSGLARTSEDVSLAVWISLATTILSFLTTLIGLIVQVLRLGRKQQQQQQ